MISCVYIYTYRYIYIYIISYHIIYPTKYDLRVTIQPWGSFHWRVRMSMDGWNWTVGVWVRCSCRSYWQGRPSKMGVDAVGVQGLPPSWKRKMAPPSRKRFHFHNHWRKPGVTFCNLFPNMNCLRIYFLIWWSFPAPVHNHFRESSLSKRGTKETWNLWFLGNEATLSGKHLMAKSVDSWDTCNWLGFV